MADTLEARRDAFKQQTKLLVPLDEVESRVLQASAATSKVTLPEKNKDDVFVNKNLDKPSTIDVASDDVNWYSVDKQRPGHAPGYVAKVVAADPDAVAALSATIIKLANENNSNIVLAWLEFPGNTVGAPQPKKPRLSNECVVSQPQEPKKPKKSKLPKDRDVSQSQKPKKPELSHDRDVSQLQEPRLSLDDEATRFKKLRLSHDLSPSVLEPGEVHSNPGPIKCGNCQRTGHTLAQCPMASYKIGNTGGCPLHNTKLHNLDSCEIYAGRDLPALRDYEVIALCNVQVFGRAKMPAIRSKRFFWLDCLAEAVKRKLIDNALDRPAALELPWTDDYTRKVAARESNDPKLKGTTSLLELCSTKNPAQFYNLLPADPFWANKKTIGVVAADHAQGKLEHLRWAPNFNPRLIAATKIGSSAPPKGGKPVASGDNGLFLTDNDKRNISIDLRKELGDSGLLNPGRTIVLPEQVMAMTPVHRSDRFDAENRDIAGVKRLSFDTVRCAVSRYRRGEINERHWDRSCPVERMLIDMVAEARSSMQLRAQRLSKR